MKTVKLNGKREKVTYKTSTDMYTFLRYYDSRPGLYGADVYTIDNNDSVIALVAKSGRSCAELRNTTKIISSERYAEIAALYDPYNAGAYHLAIMSELGFE